MKMLRMLLWDVDGTLFDTYPAFAQAFSRVLAEKGIDMPLTEIEVLARQSLGTCAETLAQAHKDEGLPRKPAPTSFLTMMARHNLIRAEVVAIGDRDIDIAAGVQTCYFGTDPTGMGADCAAHDYGQLLEWLRFQNEMVLRI